MVDETDVNKVQFLTSLAKSIAQTKCLADHVSAICMILLCEQGVVFLSTLSMAYICSLFSIFGGMSCIQMCMYELSKSDQC